MVNGSMPGGAQEKAENREQTQLCGQPAERGGRRGPCRMGRGEGRQGRHIQDVQLRRFQRGLRFHDEGRARRRKDGPPPRVVQRVQPGGRDAVYPRPWRAVAQRHHASAETRRLRHTDTRAKDPTWLTRTPFFFHVSFVGWY